MATPPERYKTTKSIFSLARSLNNRGCNFRSFLNAEISKKTKGKPKQGSKRYRHLRKFIERRREKKIEKRSTLDLTAQVIFMMMMIMMIWRCKGDKDNAVPACAAVDDDAYDDNDDYDDDDVVKEEVFEKKRESGNCIDGDDDNNDGDGDDVCDCELQSHCFSPSTFLTSTWQTCKNHSRGGCQRRETP